MAAPKRPTKYGSSPNVSPTLPQRGSRNTSTFGVKAQCDPVARISIAVSLPIRYAYSSEKVDASEIGEG